MKISKRGISAVVSLILVLALLGGGAAIAGKLLEKTPVADGTADETVKGKESILPSKKIKLLGETYSYDHQIESYLLLGTDASGNEEAEGEAYEGSMADVLCVLVLDKTAKTYALLQLNRDTITKVDLMTRDGECNATAELQLCTAHWYGGNKTMSCENTVTAVSRMLGGVSMNGYVALSMQHITFLNHLVGGVTVTIEDDFSAEDASLVMGETITLTDEQAEHYIRARMGVGDGENLSRMRRQRQYLTAFAAKAKEQLGGDAKQTLSMAQDILAMSTTDLTEKKLSGIADMLYQYENLGIYTIDGTSALGMRLGDGLEHAEYYLDDQSLVDTLTELYSLKKEA